MSARLAAVIAAFAFVGCGAPQGTSVDEQYGTFSADLRAAVGRALQHIDANGSELSVATSQVAARDVVAEADGQEHVRFDRKVNGVRVLGGDLVVHGTREGAFRGFSATTRADLANVDLSPALAAGEAISRGSAEFQGLASGNSTAELVVNARGSAPVLAYDVTIEGTMADQTPSLFHVLVNAKDGTVIDKWDEVETSAAAGTGNGFFNGTVALTTDFTTSYALRDPSRGSQYTVDMKNKQGGSGTLFTDADNVWGNGTLSDRATVAVDAQYGTAMTWDYYKNTYGRNGIANNGVGAYNRVHYGSRYNNAFWQDSCFCMTYGDGDGVNYNPFDSLDVAGHEMTHGVTSRTANLTYSGESGGLNESMSDIFGSMVEYFANNPSDPGDYLIGERLYKSNPTGTKALRYMFKPSQDGISADCWSSSVGSLDVHYSSGVGNHFFYLLAEGSSPAGGPASPTCNGSAVTGIGRTAAAAIVYRALTVYMTSSTNYAGARQACLSAATDLYGAGSAQYNAVAAAWSAVSVN